MLSKIVQLCHELLLELTMHLKLIWAIKFNLKIR